MKVKELKQLLANFDSDMDTNVVGIMANEYGLSLTLEQEDESETCETDEVRTAGDTLDELAKSIEEL